MKRAARWALLCTVCAVSFVLVWDFTPRASSYSRNEGAATVSAPVKKQQLGSPFSAEKSFKRMLETSLQSSSNRQAEIMQGSLPSVGDDDDDEPDLPPGMAGRIDKEAYLRARGDYIDMLRGRGSHVPEEARENAIRQMEKQEAQMTRTRSSLSPLVNTTDWSVIGPAPIPLGQTSTTRVPVSGRTISIAVHPTDPDTVYVGAAQGGLYKSTNGGTNWTKLFDFQLESLAIGAITIDPVDSSIVYVGTGEPNLSADSFAGRGLYILRNANSANPTLTGPFRLDANANDVFSGRAIGRIAVNATDHNVIFVCTTSGSGGNPNTTPLLLPPRGIYRSTNAQSANPTFSQVQITGLPTPNDRSTIDIVEDPANPNLLVATVVGLAPLGDGGIYRTT